MAAGVGRRFLSDGMFGIPVLFGLATLYPRSADRGATLSYQEGQDPGTDQTVMRMLCQAPQLPALSRARMPIV